MKVITNLGLIIFKIEIIYASLTLPLKLRKNVFITFGEIYIYLRLFVLTSKIK